MPLNPQFIEMLRTTGDPRFDRLPETLETTTPEVSVRLNPLKNRPGDEPLTVSHLAAEGRGGSVPWWPQAGLYLTERPQFTFDSALHQGRYYVQDASSMVTAAVARMLATRVGAPLLWLDACAAPGGKTTAALDGLPAGSLVVANEYDFQRAEILRENVTKWGSAYTVVSRGDTSRYSRLRETFDVIAVDAPCSGEGMMRKDAVARTQWSPRLVRECAATQRQIIGNLWEALRPGGYLVYSTCTFNTTENEAMVRHIIDEYGAEPVIPDFAGVGDVDGAVILPGETEALPAMRFIPGRTRGEGLFMAILRKPGELRPAILDTDTPAKTKKTGKNMSKAPASMLLKQAAAWLDPARADSFDIIASADTISFFPKRWSHLLPRLEKSLDILSAGVEAAAVKGDTLIPSHPLAMSTILAPGAFPQAELPSRQALTYLMRETPQLPDGSPRGFLLLTYRGYPLGFVKNLGNRANNLYPKEWRIKSKLML